MSTFQEEMEAVVTVNATVRGRGKHAHIVWTAYAFALDQDQRGARLLASASVSMITRGGGGTDAALLLLLYELDRDWYRQNEAGVQRG